MKRSYLQNDKSNDFQNDYDVRRMNRNEIEKKFDNMFKKCDTSEGSSHGGRNLNNSFESQKLDTLEGESLVKKLTTDEKNKINAKILKAQLKGDNETVEKLKKKLEEDNSVAEGVSQKKTLFKINEETGNLVPVIKRNKTTNINNSSTVNSVFEKEQTVAEMVAEEKTTTAADQITMFSRSIKSKGKFRTDEDCVIDDNLIEHKKKRRHIERDAKAEIQRNIKDHKKLEKTLENCKRCIDSKYFNKQCIVAIGIKTYLSVVPFEGLNQDHCFISTSQHYTNTVTLDEDVYEEMRLWRKGLVAMWKEKGMDCVFIETFKKSNNKYNHIMIEGIPLPEDIGSLVPIYFKKALSECGPEWGRNKKFFDLSKEGKGNIKNVIPKNFSYFIIDFGLQNGFVHVIEDDETFPSSFAHEILCGMLDLDSKYWRNMNSISSEKQIKKCDAFKRQWFDGFDWTERAKTSLRSENNL